MQCDAHQHQHHHQTITTGAVSVTHLDPRYPHALLTRGGGERGRRGADLGGAAQFYECLSAGAVLQYVLVRGCSTRVLTRGCSVGPKSNRDGFRPAGLIIAHLARAIARPPARSGGAALFLRWCRVERAEILVTSYY